MNVMSNNATDSICSSEGVGQSGVGTAPPSGAQGHTESWLSGFIVLVKVQPKAQEPETFIRTGRQQHQKLLHNPLQRNRKNKTVIAKRTIHKTCIPTLIPLRVIISFQTDAHDGGVLGDENLSRNPQVYTQLINGTPLRKRCPFYKYKLAANKFYLKELTNRCFHFALSSTRIIKTAKQLM